MEINIGDIRLVYPDAFSSVDLTDEKELAVYHNGKLMCVVFEDTTGKFSIDIRSDAKVTASPNNLSLQVEVD